MTEEIKRGLNDDLGHVRRNMEKEIKSLSESLARTDHLKSLEKTLELFAEEQQKFRYFNLNSEQTKSLLEYLHRLHSQISTHFEELDNSIERVQSRLDSLFAAKGMNIGLDHENTVSALDDTTLFD